MIQDLTPAETKIYTVIMKHHCYTPRDVTKKLSLTTGRSSVCMQMKSVIRKLGYKNVTEMVLEESRKHASNR